MQSKPQHAAVAKPSSSRNKHYEEVRKLEKLFNEFLDTHDIYTKTQYEYRDDDLQVMKRQAGLLRERTDSFISKGAEDWDAAFEQFVDNSLLLTRTMRAVDEALTNPRGGAEIFVPQEVMERSYEQILDKAKAKLRTGDSAASYLHKALSPAAKTQTYWAIQRCAEWRETYERQRPDLKKAIVFGLKKAISTAKSKGSPKSGGSDLLSPVTESRREQDCCQDSIHGLAHTQKSVNIAAVQERCDDFLDESRGSATEAADRLVQNQSPIRARPGGDPEIEELTYLRIMIGKAQVLERLCSIKELDMASGKYEAAQLALKLSESKALRHHFEVAIYADADAAVFYGRVVRSRTKEPSGSSHKFDKHELEVQHLKLAKAILVELLAHDLGLAAVVREAQALQDILHENDTCSVAVDGVAQLHALDLYALFPVKFQHSDFVNDEGNDTIVSSSSSSSARSTSVDISLGDQSTLGTRSTSGIRSEAFL